MKNVIRTILSLCLSAIIIGCTQDNVHMPETKEVIVYADTATKKSFPKEMQWAGTLTTSVPGMESMFPPSSVDNYLIMSGRTDAVSGYATLVLGTFSIDIAAMKMHYDIENMTIPEVQYTTFPDGQGVFKKPDFTATAGQFSPVGSLSGTFDAEGNVTLSMTYKFGKMPMEILSEFTGKLQKQQ